MKFTYLLVNFFTIIIPFIYSFHRKINFYKTWSSFFPAAILTGLLYIIWDVYFTSWGVWGFNNSYITGIKFLNLPIEEILFFLCIPYACVFTFHCLEKFFPVTLPDNIEFRLTLLFIIASVVIALIFHQNLYTLSTFLVLAVVLMWALFIQKISWLSQFYVVYGFLLLPFFVVNGILTGNWIDEPVVWYNEAEFTGLRITTIPLEDIFYGMALILMNLLLFKTFKKWRSKTSPVSAKSI